MHNVNIHLHCTILNEVYLLWFQIITNIPPMTNVPHMTNVRYYLF